DYPDDPTFTTSVLSEVDQQLARLQARPCVAIICGNSEGEQQAAMSGAGRERWSPPLFHDLLAERASASGFAYTPSSTHGGAFPHAANAGPTSYYGVGAYLRPLEDARRAEVRFASECLAFANIPLDGGLPRGAASRVQQAIWKARSPRDLGAGWDFDDVRDYYVQRLYGIDPTALRVSDHERYLELGRAATGEVMAQVFAEWRRARSPTRGGLIWWLRDLWPGAGWGVIDARGVPKPCFYPLRRALAPIALALSDEGGNGLAIHVVNDHPDVLAARVEIVLYRDGEIVVGRGAREVVVAGHAAIELAATDLFEGFIDLSFAYRFGPSVANVIHVALVAGDNTLAETYGFPSGLPSTRERDVGLQALVAPCAAAGECEVTISCARFAQSVVVDVPGFVADDGYFHLLPGRPHVVRLRRDPRSTASARGVVIALNAEAGAPFDIAS
ncbi:MAG: glycoside hydrolase family 2 protein, partial [Dokdonella sp.]